MTPSVQTFCECLQSLMKRHGLSVASLAAKLGTINAVSIRRLLKDEASPKRQAAFIDAIAKHPDIFDKSELERLKQSKIVSDVGKSIYQSRLAIHRLLFEKPLESEPYFVEVANCTLVEYMRKLPPSEPLQIICFNCCEYGILSAIASVFSDPNRVIEMNHYVCTSTDACNPAQMLQSALDLLFDPRYHLRTVSYSINSSDAYFFMPHLLLIKTGIGPRSVEKLLLIRNDHKVLIMSNLQRIGVLAEAYRMLNDMSPPPNALRPSINANSSTTFRDYLFLCYQREKNRAIYQLKADLCQELFPPDLLVDVFKDAPDIDEQTKAQMIESIYPIIWGRLANIKKKAKPTYQVFDFESTARFFETGMLLDQYFSLRPFTKPELRKIADQFLDLARNHPRYHFFFLKGAFLPESLQFLACSDLGVLMCRNDTHYDVQNAVCEVVLNDPVFLNQFISFYQDVLLKHCVYTQEESIQMLQTLRDRLDNE